MSLKQWKSPYLLVTGDFVKTGGMDRANFALADYLARQGHAVHLVAHRVDPALAAYPNVYIHHVPKLVDSYLLSQGLFDRVGRFWARQVQAAGGQVLVNGGNCQWGDRNWVHYVHAAYQPEYQTGLLRQVKGAIAHRSFLKAEQRALHQAQTIIVNSNQTKRHLVEILSIPKNRIQTIYYGIDPEVFYPATQEERCHLRQQLGWQNDRPVVVFIGALGDRRKGFDTLFQAWQMLCHDPDWDANLTVIGAGAELPQWYQRTQEAGLTSRIQFSGFCTDVADRLRAADCLVAPTRYEAYGLGVHEALCCGLPAIVTATAGVAERYPSDLIELLLSNPETATELVAKLYHWRQEIESYRQRLEPLSQQLRSYTWDTMSATILLMA